MSQSLVDARRPFAPGDTSLRPAADPWLIIAAAILVVIGLAALFSIDDAGSSKFFSRQLLLAAIGLIPFFVFWRVNPAVWHKASWILYAVNLLLLLAVLAIGASSGGAQRWLGIGSIQFQPSELSKLLLALTLASFYANRFESVKKLWVFALSFLHVLPPMLLVFKQPHLGGVMTLIAIWLIISIVAGVPWKYFVVLFVGSITLGLVAWNAPGVLMDYQRERVIGFIRPDPQVSGYQQHRALIAIAGGKVTGEGYLRGGQKAGGYIPEQHTDFILTVIGEEGGLIGCLITLSVFGLFFRSAWRVALLASTTFTRLAASGVLGFLVFHTFVNLGMNLALMPVVGLWLPFISYGGSALWLCMASLGLLASIR